MNIYFHTNMITVEDYHYYFKTQEYWRLPPRASGDFSPTYEEQYIKVKNDFTYEVCATVKHIAYKKEQIQMCGVSDNSYSTEYEEHGIVVFQMQNISNYKSMTLTFFVEFDDFDGADVAQKIQLFKEGQNYKANVSFYLDAGPINSIVHRLWDNIQNRSTNLITPFSIFKIENIYKEGYWANTLQENIPCEIIIDTRYILQDELIGDTLDYYTVDSKIKMVSLGDWQFGFIHLSHKTMPEIIARIGSMEMCLTEALSVKKICEIVELMKKDCWFDENDEPLSFSFEEENISFIKMDIPKSGWDGEYHEDIEDVDILVRYTDPVTNNIATLSNLKEIEAFSAWYSSTYETYKILLQKAKTNDYKFV